MEQRPMKTEKMRREKVGYFETFGLIPFDKALKEAAMTLFGKGKIPPSQFGLSSVKIFRPWISIPLWLGRTRKDRKTLIYNFYNREKAPDKEPYSVKKTFARDFMGGRCTYDGHIGTDFTAPVGTRIVAAAPGKVIGVARHFDHGGLKIYMDHGVGVVTMYEHLTRSLVREGETVGRGRTIAISGASGIDMFTFAPWVAPHLHFNVVLNGRPVDPFSMEGEEPLWLAGNSPVPHSRVPHNGYPDPDTDFTPTDWNKELLDAAIDECSDHDRRVQLKSEPKIARRAAELIGDRISYKTLFASFPPICESEFPRAPLLDLPFCNEDFVGAVFP